MQICQDVKWLTYSGKNIDDCFILHFGILGNSKFKNVLKKK